VSVCVFFDKQRVGVEDLAFARRHAGDKALPVAFADTSWPAGAEPPERIRPGHDLEVQDAVMAFIADLKRALDEAGAGGAGWRRRGVDLVEVARCQLLPALTPWVARWRALREIQRRWQPSRIVWVACPARRREARLLRLLCRHGTTPGCEVVYAGLAAATPLWLDAAKTVGRPVMKSARRWRDAGRAVLRQLRSRSVARRLPRPNGQPQVYFADYYPNSVKASLPVAEKLAEEGVKVTWLAGRDLVAQALGKASVAHMSLDDIVPAFARLRGRARAAERGALARALALVPPSVFPGTDGLPDSSGYLRAAARRSLLEVTDEAAAWVEIFHAIFADSKAAAIVSTTYSSTFGRAAALCARAAGAKSVFIQHGQMPAHSCYSFFTNDLMLMWGRYEAEGFARFGQAQGRFRVTGPVLYDRLVRELSQIQRPFPPPEETLRVTFMASVTGGKHTHAEAARRTLQVIAETVKAEPNAHLTVKPHPGDTTRVVDEVLDAYPGYALVRDRPAREVLEASDVVILAASSTAFEACLCDRPVIIFNLTGTDEITELPQDGAALLVEKEGDLAPALRRLREDSGLRAGLSQGRQRVIERRLAGGKGDAALRAAHEVLALVRGEAR
jgi:hypothetical protein